MTDLLDRQDADPSDGLTFDTHSFSGDDAFARYRELYSPGTEVLQTGPDVQVTIEGWRLDRMLLYHRHLNDVGHRRDPRRVQADGFTHFTATLLFDGELEVVSEGEVHRPRPGEVLLIDTHVPSANRMRHARLVTLSIARDRMRTIAGEVDALHGLTLTADEARLFREFVESLLRNLPAMSRAATAAAAGVLATLLMVAIDNSGAGRRNPESLRDLERLVRLKQLIDARAGDPDFDAAAAIRESGLSRATIYRLVVAEGGLATLIRNRRIERIRRRLSDPAETRPFADIALAAGFASISHASRVFVERYDIRPSDYRDVVTSRSGADALVKMRFWMEEVR